MSEPQLEPGLKGLKGLRRNGETLCDSPCRCVSVVQKRTKKILKSE